MFNPKFPDGHKQSVKNTISLLKAQDNSMESVRCSGCGKVFTKGALVAYKGLWCQVCFHSFYQAEYDITPNDKVAKYLIKCGSKSVAFKKATKEQQQYAIEWYKVNGMPKEDKIKEQIEGLLNGY